MPSDDDDDGSKHTVSKKYGVIYSYTIPLILIRQKNKLEYLLLTGEFPNN